MKKWWMYRVHYMSATVHARYPAQLMEFSNTTCPHEQKSDPEQHFRLQGVLNEWNMAQLEKAALQGSEGAVYYYYELVWQDVATGLQPCPNPFTG